MGSRIKILWLVSLFLLGCGQLAFQDTPKHIENFKGILVDGGKTTFEEQKGKATLLTLTASWCPACREELPLLRKLDQEFSDSGFKIIMVSEDKTAAIAAKFKKRTKSPWTTFHWNYDMMNTLGNPGVIPVSYLVDENNNVVKFYAGVFDENDLRKSIRKILK